MADSLWHEDTIRQVSELLAQDSSVLGLLLIGSCSRSDIRPDAWSDVDMVVVVDDCALRRFHPSTDWLAPLGELYAQCLNRTDDYYVVRACFADCRRADFVIVTESSLERIGTWRTDPLRFGGRLLFSRSSALGRALARSLPAPPVRLLSHEQFREMCNDFWFKGMLAVTKAGREELLVALHLSLDMVRDCLVLGMAIRDRETGSNRHRDGRQGNHFIPRLEQTRQPYTALGILDSIEESALAFDALAHEWSSHYRPNRKPLLRLTEQARDELMGRGTDELTE